MKVYGLGLKGEKIAKRFLKRKGFKVLETNFQCRFGEIDLIARDKDCLVFCEVRTRSADALVSPLESVTYAKQQKLIKTARFYFQLHQLDTAARFDVVAVTLQPNGRFAVEHLENVFS